MPVSAGPGVNRRVLPKPALTAASAGLPQSPQDLRYSLLHNTSPPTADSTRQPRVAKSTVAQISTRDILDVVIGRSATRKEYAMGRVD